MCYENILLTCNKDGIKLNINSEYSMKISDAALNTFILKCNYIRFRIWEKIFWLFYTFFESLFTYSRNENPLLNNKFLFQI